VLCFTPQVLCFTPTYMWILSTMLYSYLHRRHSKVAVRAVDPQAARLHRAGSRTRAATRAARHHSIPLVSLPLASSACRISMLYSYRITMLYLCMYYALLIYVRAATRAARHDTSSRLRRVAGPLRSGYAYYAFSLALSLSFSLFLSVCLYVCMYVCMYVCIYIYIHTYIFIYICSCRYIAVDIYISMYRCIDIGI
jgi:hypothetical protein